jgi:ankyrin repeat protein/predicted DNA-binding WGR domain protein
MRLKKPQPKRLYSKNDFLVVKDKTAKDNFTLVLVKRDVYDNDAKAKVVFMIRDKDSAGNSFVPLNDQELDLAQLLFKAEDVTVKESKDKGGPTASRKDLEIQLKRRTYNFIKSKVDEILAKEKLEEKEPEEEEEEDEDEADQADSVEMRQLKREQLLNKIAEPGRTRERKGRMPSRGKSRGKSSVASKPEEEPVEVVEADEEEPMGDRRARPDSISVGRRRTVPARPKTRSVGPEPKAPAPKRASKKAIKAPPTFKKGLFNTNAKFVQKSEQYEGASSEPTFECCIDCNNKEFVRAMKCGNPQLLKNLTHRLSEVSSTCVPQGPRSGEFPFAIALRNGLTDSLLNLLQLESDQKAFSKRARITQFQLVQTGENDKYAYGVKTRQVEMGRSGREGTNAFMYDSVTYQTSLNVPSNVTQLCRNLKSLDLYMRLQALHRNFDSTMNYNFYQAIEQGNVELASWVAKKFVESDGFGFNKFHHLALVAESPDELAGMTKVNGRKKAISNRQVTPTHLACLNKNPDILRRFLDVSEETYITDELTRKPIHYAAMGPTTAGLVVLLERGIDCRDYDKQKWTPLMFAAMANRPENIKLMTEHVAYNVNLKNRDSNAAIHIACQYKNMEAVRALLAAKADINLPGKNRMTPLMMACEADCFEIAQFLLAAGAKVTPSDKFRKSALHHAVISGNIRTVSLILTKGAEMNKADSSGNTALHFACAYGHYELIDVLIAAGANINAANGWNLQPILVALMKNHYRCVKLLVNYQGIDVNCQDSTGTSLIMSCLAQFTPISLDFCRFLITNKGADVNLSDLSGNGVFHKLALKMVTRDSPELGYSEAKAKYAADRRLYQEFYKLLSSQNINHNQRNLKGFTALEMALSEENFDFVELAVQDPRVDFVSPNNDGKVILGDISWLFFRKNGLPLASQIIAKYPDIKALEKVFDKEGLNFYHQILLSFVTRCRNNPFLTYYASKAAFYISCMKKAQDAGEATTQDLLFRKLKAIENKPARNLDRSLGIFETFNRELAAKNFNFFVRVKIVYTPWKEHLEKRQTANVGGRRSRNVFGNQLYYPQYPSPTGQAGEAGVSPQNDWADMVVNDKAGCTLFHLLMSNPIERVLRLMLDFAVRANEHKPNEPNFFGETVFLHFARNFTTPSEVPKMLVMVGEDPNLDDGCGNYPLLKVCENGNKKCLEQFLNLGPQLDVAGPDGVTAFLFFAKRRAIAECQDLLTRGANPNATDSKGRNALHWTINNNVEQDTNFELEEILINWKVDVNRIDSRGRQPIHYFFVKIGDPFGNSKKDPIEILADFLGVRALDIDRPDNFGNSPLCYAAQRGSNLCFGAMVKRGADINRRNKALNCPLTIALLNNHLDIAVFCLQKGVQIDKQVHDINIPAASQWIKLLEQFEEARDRKSGKNLDKIGVVRPGIIKESMVNQYIVARKADREILEKFEDKKEAPGLTPEDSPRSDSLDPSNIPSGYSNTSMVITSISPFHNKAPGELTVPQLREMAQTNFLKRKLSIFRLGIEKGADAVNYLLVDGGLNLGSAIMDTIEAGLFKYTVKLLTKRVDQNDPNFNNQFQFLNENKQNLAHVFAKHASFLDFSNAENILNLLVQKKVPMDAQDIFGVTPLLYVAYHSKNTQLIDSFIKRGANTKMVDKGGNWLLSAFIQDHPLLKKTVDVEAPAPENSKRRAFGAKKPRKRAISMAHITPQFGGFSNFPGFSNFMSMNNTSQFTPNSFAGSQSLENSAIHPMPFNFAAGGDQFGNMAVHTPSVNAGAMRRLATLGAPNAFYQFNPGLNPINEEPNSSAEAPPNPVQEVLHFITKMLLANQGQVNGRFEYFVSSKEGVKNKKKHSLLSYALKRFRNLDLAKVLIDHGCNVNAQDDKGFTVLTWAIRENQTEIVQFLLQYWEMIDFTHIDNMGRSYVHHIVSPMNFASYENLEFLDLVGRRVNVNRLDSFGKPAIFYAAFQESGRMRQQLRLLGAADFQVPAGAARPANVLVEAPFYTNDYDFEEDHAKAVEQAERRLKDTDVEVIESAKPNPLIVGRTTIVFGRDNKPYDVKLIKVDIKRGHYSANVYYQMQIVREEVRKIHVLFTNWGRVGTEGQYQQTPFFSLEDAVKEFKKIFREKTGNDYDDLAHFEKKLNKYRLIQTKPKVVNRVVVALFDPDTAKTAAPRINRELVQFMANITDKKLLQVVYSNFNLDPDLMPFGNLSRQTIQEAKAALADIATLAKNMETNQRSMTSREVFELSMDINEKVSRYLEIIPTVGNKQEQIPSFNMQKVANEMVRLNDLENLEIVSRILGAATYRMAEMHPYEYCLRSLNIKIVRLPENNEEFELVNKYVKATQASTNLAISNIYAVERKGEAETFAQWAKLENKRLLWHGTRTENVMGILHQGLRIAPSEAQRTGARLGNGLYFSDFFQRAASFSSDFGLWNAGNQKVYVLLVEVALGKMQKVWRTEDVKALGTEFNSIKGQGRQTPDKSQRIYLSNGTMIPLGKPVVKHERPPGNTNYFEFQESEYAIFNKTQAKIRYLVELTRTPNSQGDEEEDVWS